MYKSFHNVKNCKVEMFSEGHSLAIGVKNSEFVFHSKVRYRTADNARNSTFVFLDGTEKTPGNPFWNGSWIGIGSKHCEFHTTSPEMFDDLITTGSLTNKFSKIEENDYLVYRHDGWKTPLVNLSTRTALSGIGLLFKCLQKKDEWDERRNKKN